MGAEAFSALGALGIVILVNDRLSKDTSYHFFKQLKEDEKDKQWYDNWLITMIASGVVFWSLILLAGACLSVILSSDVIMDYAGLGSIMELGLPIAISLTLCNSHRNRLINVAEMTEFNPDPVLFNFIYLVYFGAVSSFFANPNGGGRFIIIVVSTFLLTGASIIIRKRRAKIITAVLTILMLIAVGFNFYKDGFFG